jgi:hypothetical protein
VAQFVAYSFRAALIAAAIKAARSYK